jgi:LPS O-antigen subunit length determinant protein (WzzB/FepE family)
MRKFTVLLSIVASIAVTLGSPMVSRRQLEVATHRQPVHNKPRKLTLQKFMANSHHQNNTRAKEFHRNHIQKFAVAKEKQVAYMGNTGKYFRDLFNQKHGRILINLRVRRLLWRNFHW